MVTYQGNIYAIGTFQDSTILGSITLRAVGGLDIWVASWDSLGSLRWAYAFGDSLDDLGKRICVSSAGVVYAGFEFRDTVTIAAPGGLLQSRGSSDVAIVAISPAGTLLAAYQGGGTGTEQLGGLIADGVGNVYVAGSFCSTTWFGAKSLPSRGYDDLFLVKFNSVSGNVNWLNRIGGRYYETAYDLALQADTAVFLTGYFEDSCFVDEDSLFMMDGRGEQDIMVVKYDSAGNLCWFWNAGSNLSEQGHSLTIYNNQLYVAGSFRDTVAFNGSISLISAGGMDAWWMKMNPSTGSIAWVQRGGGTGYDNIEALSGGMSSDNLLVAAGHFQGSATFGTFTLNTVIPSDQNALWMSIDANTGNIIEPGAGGSDYHVDAATCVAADAYHHIWMGGFFNNTADFTRGNYLVSVGGQDLFLLRATTGFDVGLDAVQDLTGLSVYPNPGKDVLMFGFTDARWTNAIAELFDLQGRLVATILLDAAGAGIETSSLAGGAYFWKVSTTEGNHQSGIWVHE